MHHVIYHANCQDGFCGAYIINKYVRPYPVNYIPMHYGQTLGEIKFSPEDTVYIVDFSLEPIDLCEIANYVKTVYWADHHISAIEKYEKLELPKNIYKLLDVTNSGAYNLWKLLFPDKEVPLLVSYVSDRDCWKYTLPYSRQFSTCLYSYDNTFDAWDEFETMDLALIVDKGAAISKYMDKLVKGAVAHAKDYRLDVYVIKAVNSSILISEIGTALSGKALFAVVWFMRDGVYQYSLRSKEFDVAYIAKKYGGGGHKNAAGFSSKEFLLRKVCSTEDSTT